MAADYRDSVLQTSQLHITAFIGTVARKHSQAMISDPQNGQEEPQYMTEKIQETGSKPSLLSRIVHWLFIWFYRRHGWTAIGKIPYPRKFVIVAAPHTSNWDFVYFLGLTNDLGVRPHFMAKRSLFGWPFRNFMYEMGGVPVDRGGSKNYVQQMIAEFAKRDEFMLTIAPEGTRSSVAQWKTGFYHIAYGAGVPIVLGSMDYAKRIGGFAAMIMPTGDYAADMEKLREYYDDVTPKNPHWAAKDIIGKNDS